MAQYHLNKQAQANGDHEVHNETMACRHMPAPENRFDLGAHASCHSAVARAKSQKPEAQINGCYYCCRPCHTQ